MKSLVLGTSLALLTMLASCSKDPPPKPADEPKKATPVPSDMVLNDFMPTGGGQVGLQVDGGGMEAGLAAVATDGGGDPAAGGGEEADPAHKLKVLEAGGEPRALRKYAFVANKGEKRLLTMKQSASREGGGPSQEATFTLLVELTPKVVTPKGAKFEMKVLKVEIPGVPAAQKAQADAQLAVFIGLIGRFDISPFGEISEVDFKADEKMQNGAAEMIINTLSQAVELVVPQFPEAPIGVGAKWERNVERKERGVDQGQKHTFTLKELGDGGGGVVTTDIVLNVAKRPIQARGVPAGATQEVNATGSYTYNFKFDRVATKVEGELIAKAKTEIPDGKGGKQAVIEISKLKNSMEPPK